MRIVRTVSEVRAAVEPLRAVGTVGLVPTMGAYHAGHLALFRAAREECDTVVVSLFVNPAQFGDPADLAGYPRDEERDAAVAEDEGVDLLFVPAERELYGPEHDTWVDVGELGERLEGEARPGHFRGVATICLKLFNIVRPDRAYFGQKDAQQAAVVKALVRDLDVEVEIRVLPTVRDAEGLALSSRNGRLSSADRARALALPRALEAGRAAFRRGEDPVAAAAPLLETLERDYLEVARLDGDLVLAAAVRVGGTRLIDNVILEVPCQDSSWLGGTQKGAQ